MIAWILKTALLLAGFYSFFMLFMRKTTLFRLNRVILLTGTVLCLLLPLVRINVELSGQLTDYLLVRMVLPRCYECGCRRVGLEGAVVWRLYRRLHRRSYICGSFIVPYPQGHP